MGARSALLDIQLQYPLLSFSLLLLELHHSFLALVVVSHPVIIPDRKFYVAGGASSCWKGI